VPEDRDFWVGLFGEEPPFPIIESYSDLPKYNDELLAGWPENANQVSAWWQRQKRQIKANLWDDVRELGCVIPEEPITGSPGLTDT
jgi:hypothetical protein